jgi:hypothetical protein
MVTSGTIDAALLTRQEDQQLTEIAQIGPGNPEKVRELLANPMLLPALLATFEAAADSAAYAKALETFNLQQEQKIVLWETEQDKKREEDRRNAWLESMSPEYRQAYAGLMTAIDNADKEFNRDREILSAHRKFLDQEAKDIDDKAIHLSDGRRAYVNAEGDLVDKNGVVLKGTAAAEARTIVQQRGGDVADFARFDAYQQNNQAIARTDALSQKIAADQAKAQDFGKEATNPEHPDLAKTKQHAQTVNDDAAADQAATKALASGDADRHNFAHANDVSVASLSDLDGDAGSAPAAHSSFASKLDPRAGIQANNVSGSFNSATQSTRAALADPAPLQKPTIGGVVPT